MKATEGFRPLKLACVMVTIQTFLQNKTVSTKIMTSSIPKNILSGKITVESGNVMDTVHLSLTGPLSERKLVGEQEFREGT